MSNTDPDLQPKEKNLPVAIDVVDGNLIIKRHNGRTETFPMGSGGSGGGSLVGVSPVLQVVARGTIPANTLEETQTQGKQLPLDIITPDQNIITVYDSANEDRIAVFYASDLVGESGVEHVIHTHGFNIHWIMGTGPAGGIFWIDFDDPGLYVLKSQAWFYSADTDGIRGFHVSFNSATMDMNARYVLDTPAGSQDVVKGSSDVFVINPQDATSGDDTSTFSGEVFHTSVNPIDVGLFLLLQRVSS